MDEQLVREEIVGIVGLGYVGLPLALAFGAAGRTIGLDQNRQKLNDYLEGVDPSGEVPAADFAAAKYVSFTDDPTRLAEASVIIVVVPTPIDRAKRPDLGPLVSATKTVAAHLRPGTTVVFESTVYPGCTEEVCVPILEEFSGLAWAGSSHAETESAGFFVGYSPERINPGDQTHRLDSVVKVVAGDTPKTSEKLTKLYKTIVTAGVHTAPTIRVAEAAKVIENTQRDLNIALVNELAMIFDRLDIDTLDVLEAAGTKWNFLPFKPGLVGGHCIGVDPYYLTYKAQTVGFHPDVILAGRRTNDGVGSFVSQQTVKRMAGQGFPGVGSTVTVLGITFKENCSDLRNSQVPNIVSELQDYGCRVLVHDPIADAMDAKAEYGIELTSWEGLGPGHAVVLAVPHAEYLALTAGDYKDLLLPEGLLVDVKGVIDRFMAADSGLTLWRM